MEIYKSEEAKANTEKRIAAFREMLQNGGEDE